MSSLAQVTEVTSSTPAPAALAGFSLDAPKPGFEGDSYALDLRGWAIGARSPATRVRVSSGGAVVRELPVEVERKDVAEAHPGVAGGERSGFFGTITTLALGQRFELDFEVTLEDGTGVPVATLRGTRAPLATAFEPRLRPLLLTTLARTGSTAVVRMLAAHPDVIAYRPFEYEPRVATYWLDVFRTLADPASYRRQLAPTGALDGPWWLGAQLRQPRPTRDPELHPWLEAEAVTELAALAQQRIERLYLKVAAAQSRPDASWFVEKFRPGDVPELMLELYPGAREVVLVRDFRDMVASMFSYDRKRGRTGFRRAEAASDHQYVLANVGPSVAEITDAWRRRAGRAHLLRYEDLVLRPQETVPALLAAIGLDQRAEAIAAMLASLASRDRDAAGHRTMDDPAESIGRWRQDLSDEVKAACAAALGPSLEVFGYEPA